MTFPALSTLALRAVLVIGLTQGMACQAAPASVAVHPSAAETYISPGIARVIQALLALLSKPASRADTVLRLPRH